jgi:hypothetical protein
VMSNNHNKNNNNRITTISPSLREFSRAQDVSELDLGMDLLMELQQQ